MLGEVGGLDLLLVLGHLALPLVALPQLLLDGLHLFFQEVLPLAFLHLLADPVLNLALQFQDVDLPGQDLAEEFQPVLGSQFQQLLALFQFEGQVLADQVGQLARLVGLHGGRVLLGGHGPAEPREALKLRHDPAHQGFRLQVLLDGIRPRCHAHLKVWLDLLHAQQVGAHDALDDDLQHAVRLLAHLQDFANGADGVNIGGSRVFLIVLLLRGQQNHAVPGQGGFQGTQRLRPAHAQGRDLVRHDHRALEGKQRQDVLVRDLSAFGHVASSASLNSSP